MDRIAQVKRRRVQGTDFTPPRPVRNGVPKPALRPSSPLPPSSPIRSDPSSSNSRHRFRKIAPKVQAVRPPSDVQSSARKSLSLSSLLPTSEHDVPPQAKSPAPKSPAKSPVASRATQSAVAVPTAAPIATASEPMQTASASTPAVVVSHPGESASASRMPAATQVLEQSAPPRPAETASARLRRFEEERVPSPNDSTVFWKMGPWPGDENAGEQQPERPPAPPPREGWDPIFGETATANIPRIQFREGAARRR